MGIKAFIQDEVLAARLREARSSGLLVVYDPHRRYRGVCLELAAPHRRVIDATESSIESREAALEALLELGQANTPLKEMLVYVPASAPVTDEEKQRDPFSALAACGAVFPAGDGDEYQSLCLKARADQATEIRRIFQNNPDPDFAMIDAVGGGAGWPQLETLLQAHSAPGLLIALLVPTDRQKEALKAKDTWVSEARDVMQSALGMKLLTKSRTWAAIAEELWRFLLYSEFLFDLPPLQGTPSGAPQGSTPGVALPSSLLDVPHAPPEARELVLGCCAQLRSDRRYQAHYIDRAETIEAELNLLAACQGIQDLGERDTFPFEERSFFMSAIQALKADRIDVVRGILARRAHSVWVGRGENQAQWAVLQAALRLMEVCEDSQRQLPDHVRDQGALIDYYLLSLREADRLLREFEQVAGEYLDLNGTLREVTAQARTSYSRLLGSVQNLFIKQLEKSGWPPPGRLANADVFDRLVVPKLAESGRRVALFFIDALRYELGVELQKLLAEHVQVELQPAFAALPSITAVGMASLLPGAGQGLKLVRRDGQLVPTLHEQPVTSVAQRMEPLRKRYGQRFAETPLKPFAQNKVEVSGDVELLVLRSNEIDSDFESNPEAAPALISRTFQQIRVALHRLRGLGFQDALIVTDHGFCLNSALGPGEVCTKPPGAWLNCHDRLLLGDGTGDASNAVFSARHLGMMGDFEQVASPRAMVSYRAGQSFFHGGASLQEAVVPVLTVRLPALEKKLTTVLPVTLHYKRGAKKITTRLPVIEVEVGPGDLFSQESRLDIVLEAHDKKGNVIGEPRPGGAVNPATRTLSVKAGETLRITLKMDLEFEGRFTVKALDPTTLKIFSKLELETDYTV